MSENTKIEWCTYSASPWEGCTKVSSGCLNCYAAARDARHLHEPVSHWGKGAPRRVVVGFRSKVLAWNAKAAREGNRPTVFPSVCDWLDDEVPIELLSQFMGLVYETPHLCWLLLTKRPENWKSRLEAAALWAHSGPPQEGYWGACIEEWISGTPPANVWVGTSVEDQPNADRRIPELLKIPAVGRFLSLEPLLGPVDLERPMPGPDLDQGGGNKICQPWYIQSGLDWIIIGGESGHGSRPCNLDWIRSLVKQGKEAGVATFVKQDSGLFPGKQGRIPNELWIKETPFDA